MEIKLSAFVSSFPTSFNGFAIPSASYSLLYKSLNMLWRGGVPWDELDFGFLGRSNGGHLVDLRKKALCKTGRHCAYL